MRRGAILGSFEQDPFKPQDMGGAWGSPSPLFAPVLYAEDSEDDAFFMERAFAQAGIPNPLKIVRDGQEAIDYLAGHGAYADRRIHPLPCLLLLDLSIPLKTGFEVLQWIGEQPGLQDLKVVVISASGQHLDIQLAQAMGIVDYIIKPNAPKDLLQVIKAFKGRWL